MLKTAQAILGFDTRRHHDSIAKLINKKWMTDAELNDRIFCLKLINQLGFKPIVIEKLEQSVVQELVKNADFIKQRP
jgi:hypothetical protein